MSRTGMFCTQGAMLPQPSLAVQVRVITLVPPLFLLAESLTAIVTLSLHDALPILPVTLVLVLAGHSSTRLGGQLIVGGIVSRAVTVWTQLLPLPHWSLAVQVREITLVAPQRLLTASL